MPPHCDAKDGPVVQGALWALDTSNVDEALRFAPEDAEAEIRAAFAKALTARQVGPAAKEVADAFFAETVVRLHRPGKGLPSPVSNRSVPSSRWRNEPLTPDRWRN